MSSTLRSISQSAPSALRRLTVVPPPKLITPRALSAAIETGEPRIKLIDASWHMPNSGRSALADFKAGSRLPQARFFDHDTIADTDYPGGLAHMRPDSETFRVAMNHLGISPTDTVAFYDSHGIFSAPRAAWLLHSFGHPSIVVLDGGLPRWIAEGFPTENGPPGVVERSDYQFFRSAEEQDGTEAVASYADIIANVADPRFEILDARPGPRFEGAAPEPRPGLPSGHIPGSLSLPFTKLLTPGTEGYRTFLRPEQLEDVFVAAFGSADRWEAVKRGEKGLVASCGSGMTACIIWLAVQLCAKEPVQVKIYDESWTGYAGRGESPIAVCPK